MDFLEQLFKRSGAEYGLDFGFQRSRKIDNIVYGQGEILRGGKGANPQFSPSLGKSFPSAFRSIQEVLLERFTNLPFENLLGASKNSLGSFSKDLAQNAG